MVPRTEGFSRAYIGVEIGSSTGSKREFVALETPLVVTGEVEGFFVLVRSER
jgi:hypothetical protein